jgi:hypothetical protein
LLEELLPMIREAKIERSGRIYSAPQDYWRMALEEMISKRGALTLPLKSHGYLMTIIEGYNLKAEARKEDQAENRLTGRTSTTQLAAHQRNETVLRNDMPRGEMPQSVKDALKPTRRNDHVEQ